MHQLQPKDVVQSDHNPTIVNTTIMHVNMYVKTLFCIHMIPPLHCKYVYSIGIPPLYTYM